METRHAERSSPPAAFMQLAGHPLRWRILAELGHSDRRVRELTGLVGEPQNLVSYHLRKLRDADLVRARRSSADGRDTYYTVDLTRLRSLIGATGTALHPGLHLVPSAPTTTPRLDLTDTRVLFLCTGNSARSQMAEALLCERSGGLVEARSAGSRPKALHPRAVRVMRDRYGIDLDGRHAKHVREFADERFDWVITLCDRVREACPELPGHGSTSHWSIPDPASSTNGDDDAAFEEVAAELDTRIGFLLAALAPRARPDHHPEEQR